ncbi:transferase [Lithospermum erythrorhizon]|uniref:Phosphoribosylglycinamide formyltransferase, chloroplastic n=1 Tax=Lithospermum erythrorhizon TaxID=34254 RepID=A0AAV3R496_LITER
MATQSLHLHSSSPHHLHHPKLQYFPSNSQSLKWVCLKTNHSFAALKMIKKLSIFAIDGRTSSAEIKRKVVKKKLGVFVSGGGSNFRAIHQGIIDGDVNGEVVVLVTNKPDCGGALYAKENGIPVVVFPKVKDASVGVSTEDLVASLRSFEVDYVLLAGYLKLIPVELIQEYPRNVFNIHPSLLPAFGGKGFYGMKVHRAVIASGARYSGPTIHHVDEKYDTGRILAQKVVPVYSDDTAEKLAERVLHEEHKLYAEVAIALCEDRVIWREDGVPLIQSEENPNIYR